MRDKFTICVLLYGDFMQLADRCLRSIAETIPRDHLNLRVGLNGVSSQVGEWVRSWVAEEDIFDFGDNRFKYPMMQQLMNGARPITTPYTMWFDDDSYLSGYKLTEMNNTPQWLQLVEHHMVNSDMIGAIYTINWQGMQREWVQDQAWYAGKVPSERQKIRFATGGWWTARTDMLRSLSYPWQNLKHRGGDTMLGEACYQHGLRLNHFNVGVKINADDSGRESKADRRGFDESPIGVNYDPGVGEALHRATATPPAATRLRRILEL